MLLINTDTVLTNYYLVNKALVDFFFVLVFDKNLIYRCFAKYWNAQYLSHFKDRESFINLLFKYAAIR